MVTVFQFKDEQTGLHMCAKQICDRSSSFKIIQKTACSSYGELDNKWVSGVCVWLSMEQSLCFV
jgi:hypothetical protein